MRPREVEKIIVADGWVYKETCGSHKQFVHPAKPGKVTIPQHSGDTINKVMFKRIMQQAGIDLPAKKG
jgi:predicted RNA binding protein YcfA (HicA-like mRNA interferase family)